MVPFEKLKVYEVNSLEHLPLCENRHSEAVVWTASLDSTAIYIELFRILRKFISLQ